MNFEKLKLDTKEKRGVTDELLKMEMEGSSYPMYDCCLEDFNSRFEEVLGTSIPNYLDQNYPDQKGELVGIELGGPGCKLFADLEGYFVKTIGVTLHHGPELVLPPGHQIIEADVFSKRIQKEENDLRGYQAIEEWVRENGKANLLICSMGAGVDYGLGVDLFVANLKRWYELLSYQGTALLSLPNLTNEYVVFVNELEDFLSKNAGIFYSRLSKNLGGPYNLLLKKMANAPESIDGLL